MNTLLNRLKLVNQCFRNRGYGYDYNNTNAIKNYFDIKGVDNFLEKVESTWGTILDDKRLLGFLYKQDEEVICYLKDKIEDNLNFKRYIESEHYEDMIKFKNSKEIDIFLKALSMLYSEDAKIFVKAYNNGMNYEKINYILDFFNEYQLNKNNSNYSYIEENLESLLMKKNSLWDYSFKDIFDIFTNCFEIEPTFEEIDNEKLNILKDKNACFLFDINLENMQVINNLNSLVDFHTIEDDFFDEDVRKKIYDLREYINSYIDVIKTNFKDEDKLFNYTITLIESLFYNVIVDKDDLNLITNKIKYGFIPNSAIDIALELSGMPREVYLKVEPTEYNFASILDLKKNLPKGFFKKVINKVEFVKSIIFVNKERLLGLSKVLELSQLNDNQLEDFLNILDEHTLSIGKFIEEFSSIEYKLSYDEFKCIHKNKKYLTVSNVNSVKGLKQSDRLLKLKSLIELNKILNKTSIVEKDIISDFINNNDVLDMMKRDNPLKLEKIIDYVEYKILNSAIKIDSFIMLNKVRLLVKSGFSSDELSKIDISSIDDKVWSCKVVTDVIDRMELSDDFKDKYKDNIIDFCLSENCSLVTAYYKNPVSKSKQRNGIMLIGKSIIANKYEDLKFVKDDIKKEISVDISDESFNAWKRTDTLKNDVFKVEDSSDFNKIMKMGEIPVKTCMNYVNGMYSHCLLSNFDTSKKMLVIYKNGKYVGRAIIRLTVMSDDNNSEESVLDFVDVDKNYKQNDNSSKELVLFLEKVYTTLDYNDLRKCYPLIVELLKKKADKMEAKLAVSCTYSSVVNTDCTAQNKYVFITASKNGAQYLDSFDGSTSNSYCYKRGHVYVY